MTTSQIDTETSTVTRRLTIEAPRALVWAALTAPGQIAQWFGQRADFPNGVYLGAEGLFGWTDHGDFPARIDVHEPHERFAFTWGTPGESIREDNSTTATFTLTEEGESTVLTVTESGFDTLAPDTVKRRAAMEDNAQGWNSELDELSAYVTSLREGRTAVADLDAGTITHAILVAASRPAVWAALSTPESIGAWWGHPAVFPDGVQPGSLGTFEWVGHGLFPVTIDQLDEPERFVMTWGELGETAPGPMATQVTFTLTEAGERTILTVLETGFENHEAAARRATVDEHLSGWNAVLDSLARFVEARS